MKNKILLTFLAVSILVGIYIVSFKIGNKIPDSSVSKEKDCSRCEEEREEKARAENPKEKRNDYFPETASDVAKSRSAYWESNSTFKNILPAPENLRLGGFASNWIEAGPNGAVNKWPGDEYGFIINGKIISVEQDYSDRKIIYAGTSGGGLWRSKNYGKTWKVVHDRLPCPAVSTVCSNPLYPGEVWMGTGAEFNGESGETAPLAGYLYKSTDYGSTWTQVNFTLNSPINVKINKIMIPVLNGNVIVLATSDISGGVYISVDHGVNFTKSTAFIGACTDVIDVSTFAPFGTSTINFIAGRKQSNNLYRYNYPSSSPVSTTPSSVQTITLPSGPANPLRIALTSSRIYAHGYVYVSMGNADQTWGGIWLSTDKGNTWRKKSATFSPLQMSYNLSIGVKNSDGKTVYVGGNRTQFDYSDDSTITWKTNVTPAGIHADHHAICCSWANNDTTFMVQDGGFFIIKNNGATYSTPGRLRNFLVKNAAINPTNPFDRYVTTWDIGVFHTSSGLKSDFESVGCCDGIDVAYSPTKHLFSFNFGLRAWNTGSITYPNNNYYFETGLPVSAGAQVKFNGTNFYANQFSYVYKTNGTSLPWSQVGGASALFATGVSTVDADPSGVVVAGAGGSASAIPIRTTNSSGLFVYPTSGPSAVLSWWQPKACNNVKFGTVNPTNNKSRIYACLSGITGRKVVYSNDGGISFTDITGSLSSNLINVRSILPDNLDSNIIYIGTDLGVFATLDKGINWYNFSENLPEVCFINDLDFATINSIKYIFGSSYGRGLWYSRTLLPTYKLQQTLSKANDVICVLSPNPVKDELRIRLEDASAETATIMIYDSQGKLIKEEKEIPVKDFFIYVSCPEYKPGIYFVTIICNNYKVQKKFIKV